MINNFFDDGSPYLTHPRLTPERTAAEVDRILAGLADLPRTALDLGCGFGRHTIELARRGIDAVGVDPSATMLAEAHRRADAAGVILSLLRMDGQDIVDVDMFDLVLCLFTTLGQLRGDEIDTTAGSRSLLNAAARALRPGGTLVVEVPERERAVDALVATEVLGPTIVRRRFDPARNVVHEQFEIADRRFELAYRLFSAGELCAEIEASGLEVREVIREALAPPPPTFMTVFATCPTG